MTDRLPDDVVRWHADAEYRRRNARRSLTAEQYQREQDTLAAEVLEWRAMRDEAGDHRRHLGRKVRATISDSSVKQTVVLGTLLAVSEWGEFVIEDEGGDKTFCWPLSGLHLRGVHPHDLENVSSALLDAAADEIERLRAYVIRGQCETCGWWESVVGGGGWCDLWNIESDATDFCSRWCSDG